MSERKNLIDWARNCHFDGCIAIKEVKGKKWMSVLSYLQYQCEFDIDNHAFDETWKLILNAINSLDDRQIQHLNAKRRNEY
jgi:hypothetical protein